MLRSLFLPAMAASSVAAADVVGQLDFTCTDSGTRRRIAVVYEQPDAPLPCTVQFFEHPLGRYSMKWRVLWRAEHDASFCRTKVLDQIEQWRGQGWECVRRDQRRQRPQ